MSDPIHVVVVDDEPAIGNLLTNYLSRHGFRVTAVADGEGLRRIMASERVELVLLDLGLPGEDGLSITRHLRGHSDVGVIIVTGSGEAVDRIVGLELGADDFVAKPFDLRELLARMRSVLRRTGRQGAAEEPAARRGLYFAGWRLEPASRRLFGPEGREVHLTSGEFDLLQVLVENPNKVLSRDRLLQATRGRDAAAYDRAVDMQVARIRRKIEPDADHPALIKSVRGAGYIFTAPVERA